MLTARGKTRRFFRLDVLADYRILDYLGDMYGDLSEVLLRCLSLLHRKTKV